MASRALASTALLLSFNLLFVTLVSSTNCPPPKPKGHATHPTNPSPVPSSKGSCPKDTVKLGVCVDLLKDLLSVTVGRPPKTPCCSLISDLVDLEAAVCLSTTIKASVLGTNLNLPMNLSLLLNYCGKKSKNTPTSPDPTLANENVVNPPQVTSSTIPINSQNTLIAIKVATQLPLKLSSNNYPSSRVQFQALLIGLDLTEYIDGTIPYPPTTITKGVTAPNPTHAIWLRQDSLFLHPILTSISLISASQRLSTSRSLKPLPEYLQFIKSIADELALIDKPLTDDDLTIHVLNGVGSEFRELTVAV
ncbi:hypothetical protein GH714_029903 [Hevea brasiliensis]|uniref:Hydrophobic seed protein domain-containing protein n=1 Tax=Hevea brasiliensis TaxID=3981 RepID=A0A6A6NK06_HEVBR|nr:hypothetical protein GH714_029903 [Hevea brasiliensis]